jgi:hypothetical protein
MTENDDEGSEQRSRDNPAAPCEVSKRDENAPGAAGAGQDSREELTWGLQHIPEEPAREPGDKFVPGISMPVTMIITGREDRVSEKHLAPEHASHPSGEEPSPECPAQKRETQKFVEKAVRGPGKQRSSDPALAQDKQPETEKTVPEPKGQQVTAAPAPEAVKEVFRKTELHSAPPVTEEDTELKTLRKKMMLKLRRPKCEVSYLPYETAFREFIASLMVRQDKTDAELRPQISALWDQVKVLEQRLDWKTSRLGQRMDELEERERY